MEGGVIMMTLVYAVLIAVAVTQSGWLFWLSVLAMAVIWGVIPTFMMLVAFSVCMIVWGALKMVINGVMGTIARIFGLDYDPL